MQWEAAVIKLVLKSNSHKQVKVALDTLGCKLNQAETEALMRQLSEAGCQIVSRGEEADIYILNTCTVTHVADRKSRNLIRMVHRRNPKARIVAVGCYAERAGKELSGIEGVDLVVDNAKKADLVQILINLGYFQPLENCISGVASNRTRSFIKIQDGCNNFCAYCIVPLVRGREKSLSPEEIIDGIQKRVAENHQEVVLTGTEVGRYEHSGLKLTALLERILEKTTVRRLRLSSLQPQEITAEFVELWQNPRLCRHFHLSLQSGSDVVLGRMQRRYSTTEFEMAVRLLRAGLPEASITTDIIVGFPGETEEEFMSSLEFCRRIGFSRMHVFPFSIRQGTRAAGLPDQVPASVKKERSQKMLELAEYSLRTFNQKFLGHTHEVLFEQQDNSFWTGLTGNYIRTYVKSTGNLASRIFPVKMLELKDDGILGEVSFPAGKKI